MSAPKTMQFEAEIQQLLKLVTKSLYSNDEIFIRELISNASDAMEKLHFKALTDDSLYEGQKEFHVRIEIDKDKNLIILEDTGIGMSYDEVIDNLGTIAKSGTKAFFEHLTGEQSKDAQLIGQFGVGFYSAFIVADKVIVETRKAGAPEDQGVKWVSDGIGTYEIETIARANRGTKITLHIREDKKEFLESWRLKSVIRKYSDHIPLNVQMRKETHKDEGEVELGEFENVNRAVALWTLSKNEIKPEEYQEFYKHLTHDFEDAITYSHNKVEGRQEYTTLLYIPKNPPFDLWNLQAKEQAGLKLYVKRTFIMENAGAFLPNYLRFVRGVVDSSDLPLNVSREILQNNKTVESMKSAITKRILNMLSKMAEDNKADYSIFWKSFGQVLKEGLAEDFTNKDELAALMRFNTTHDAADNTLSSLADYVSRMQPDQDKIYYITAENEKTARFSPHLEIFRKKGIEVILLTDRIDEWVVAHLPEFQGKKLQSVAKGQLELDKDKDSTEKDEEQALEETFKDVLTRVKDSLGEKVKEVRASHRLTDSPACIVVDDQELNMHMQHILKAAGQWVPPSQPILELNLKHPIVKRLSNSNTQEFDDLALLLLEQSLLVEGVPLEDPVQFVKRVNSILVN